MSTDIMFRKAVYTDYLKKSQKERAGGLLSDSFGAMNALKEFDVTLDSPFTKLTLPKMSNIIKQERAALPATFTGFTNGIPV